MAKYKQIELSTAVIDMMRNDPKFTSEFPFLTNLVKVHVVRSCCNRRAKSTQTSPDYNSIKMAFATASNEKKLKLLKLLDAERVNITYLLADKTSRTVTLN